MNEISRLLETIIREEVEEDRVALLLSGGVDSLALGFAATAIGKEVVAYTFRLETTESADSKAARSAAAKMGWPFHLIEVPRTNLEQDVITLAQKYHCVKKTQFENTFPFLYIVPEIAERFVLSGIAADGHYGLSKKAMIHFRSPKEAFDTFRRDYFGSPNPAGQVQQKAILEEYGKVQVAPYFDRRYFDLFLPLNWDAINRPVQKYPILQAYPEEFRRVGRRNHANLQLVAGVDTLFETLLQNPKINVLRRTRVMDLCRDLSRRFG